MGLGGCAGANAWCVVLLPGPGEPPVTGRRGRGVVVSQWWWVVVVGGASGEWIWVTGDEHGDKQTRKSRLYFIKKKVFCAVRSRDTPGRGVLNPGHRLWCGRERVFGERKDF